MKRRLAPLTLLLALSLLAAACSGGGDGDGEGADGGGGDGTLTGAFAVVAANCAADGTRSGSFFRMVQPGGTLEDGPFVANADSPCQDKTWTPLRPGSDGGLLAGSYQPQPDPPFDGANGAADALIAPTAFFAVQFGVSTNPVDPQSGQEVPAPSLRVDAQGKLSGDLSAVGVAWNQQHFNQGAPKPGGARPGLTAGPTGEYDEPTGSYRLSWSSQIEGGPFHNFTGVWHLEGAFAPAAE